MSSPKVNLSSYVEIAVSMDSLFNHNIESLRDPRNAKRDLYVNQPELLRFQWRKRIEEWQNLLPDRGQPIENCLTPKEITFSALFLQHPIAAMPLWNMMQAFYALDRLVCGSSENLLETVSAWETMAPFEYVTASKIVELWKVSLQRLRKEICNYSLEKSTSAKAYNTAVPGKVSETFAQILQRRSTNIESERKEAETFSRFDGISTGIARLQHSQTELRRSFQENLECSKLANTFLEAIDSAARRRFIMVDYYLNLDERRPGESQHGSKFQAGSLGTCGLS